MTANEECRNNHVTTSCARQNEQPPYWLARLVVIQKMKNPFIWYLGKTVLLGGQHYLVERFEIQEGAVSFDATNAGTGAQRQLSLFDLLALEVRQSLRN